VLTFDSLVANLQCKHVIADRGYAAAPFLFDKLNARYLAIVQFVCALIWLR